MSIDEFCTQHDTTRLEQQTETHRLDAIVSLPIIESCEGCGCCCLDQESPPGYLAVLRNAGWSDEDDIARVATLPDVLVTELLEYDDSLSAERGHPNDGICIWFDEVTRKCKHYDLRPSICRDAILVGDDACRGWRDMYLRSN